MICPSENNPAHWVHSKLYACVLRVSLHARSHYTEPEPDCGVRLFKGLTIVNTFSTGRFGQAATPFGPGLIGWTEQGVVMLHLLQSDDLRAHKILAQQYPESTLQRDDSQAGKLLEQAFKQPHPVTNPSTLKLFLNGSPFQLKVWQALQDIPFGEVRTYGELADSIGHPGAARAVGTALAANQLAFLVPCHRVIRASGESGQYRWGAERKARMLEWEARQLADSNAAR